MLIRQVDPHDCGQLKVPGQAGHSRGYFMHRWGRGAARSEGRLDRNSLGGEESGIGIQGRAICHQALVRTRGN